MLIQEKEVWLQRKVQGIMERGQQIKRATFSIRPYHRVSFDRDQYVQYLVSIHLYVKDGLKSFLEEGIYSCQSYIRDGNMMEQNTITEKLLSPSKTNLTPQFIEKDEEARAPFTYNRREAVRYAEQWWDSYNPAYQHFDVDCTNYISQCLKAGGAPMAGQPNRSKGWWYGGKNWSYSWSVAHSLRWYLSGARQGLIAGEAAEAHQLSPGDIICYDFQGDGRFDHTTIVVSKDSQGEPLVNAHTTNSRQRFWSYTDSTAYTPNIQYKFFRIGG
nr:amidase domain-containing protein [Halobacillus sp. A5]